MKYVLAIIILVSLPLTIAADITLSLPGQEFYAYTGQDAILNLTANNTYVTSTPGSLSYTVTQTINQGGMQYSSSNQHTTSYTIPPGTSYAQLDFGTAKTPMTLEVTLQFTYSDNGTRSVTLPTISLHFIDNSTQQQQQQQQVSSSSQQASQQQGQSPQQQMQQAMQQLQQQMNGQQPSQQQQTTEQRLQNNQANQDSNALKQEMQQDVQAQQQMQQAFQEQLAKNQEFQQAHEQLTQQGYNVTGADLSPSTNTTGNFSVHYQNKDGQQATIQGSMQDGQMQSLSTQTTASKQQALDQLAQDPRYQHYNQQLQQQGLTAQPPQVTQQGNQTQITIPYTSNETNATITATLNNATVTKVSLDDGKKKGLLLWPALIILASIIGYAAYRKLSKPQSPEEHKQASKPKKPFDYKAAARTLLAAARTSYDQGEHKDAYMQAGQALRLYLSYTNGLAKETTNDEIIAHLKAHGRSYQEAKACFETCSLVEFAKFKADSKAFEKVMTYAEKTIA